MPWRTLARVQLAPSSGLIMTPWPIVPTRIVPFFAMVHLQPRAKSPGPAHATIRLSRPVRGDHGPRSPRSLVAQLQARRGDLILHRRRVGKLALRAAIPSPRVVEIALEDVDDPVQPRPERRLLVLDDLVRALP